MNKANKTRKYSIGVDFGTLSGRAVLVDLANGNEMAVSEFAYPHSVMSESLPTGKKLDINFALQHPQDYLDVLAHTITDVLKQSSVDANEITGIGIDFTACTILPVLEDGTPLCFLEKYKDEPHAYVKLWKHHAAQEDADRLNKLAVDMGEKWLGRYGGKISCEWEFPKICEILRGNEEIYNETARFTEAADWIVWQLTGLESRSSCTAGYKGMWNKKDGYPSKDFFRSLDGRMENIIGTKICDKIDSIGGKAGVISALGARLTGLEEGTPVAVGNIDAHVALPAAGITQPGKMLMIIGTSTCHIMLSTKEVNIPGICGVVKDGVVPGLYAFEAGQACVGDNFDWFVKNCICEQYVAEAKSQGINIHHFLREKAKKLSPGESGLIALDWYNGNRSVLADADLSGMILGLTLQTKPEEIYLALIEATAYGTKMIIDAFEQSGIMVDFLYAAGGIAEKDELMMQIYSDVTGREIKISGSPQAPALGSAMFGAVAGGYFESIDDAAKVMSKVKDITYKPIKENTDIYSVLYNEYKILHDYFGRGSNDVMKRLSQLRKSLRR